MKRPHKPTLTDKIAAWKSAKDIVLDELLADAASATGGTAVGSVRINLALIVEASRTAALMAPWNAEED